jgi:hypothetical protein
MGTFYKYAERNADSYVNWAEVGKNMSNILSDENKIREEKKAALDEASRQLSQSILDTPMGEDASARKAALELADSATQMRLIQDRLLKSGKMKLKDYTIQRQNLTDSIDNAYKSMKAYQDSYTEIMKRNRDGVSSKGEVLNFADVEGFGDWNKSGFHILPNGQVVVAMKDEQDINGQKVYTMSSNPNKVANMNYLNQLLQIRWDKFNVDAATDNWASKLGKNIDSTSEAGTLLSTGLITSREDITTRTYKDPATKQILYDFFDAETDILNSSLSNAYDRASTLVDYVQTASNGKVYRFTNDPQDAKNNPEAILRTTDKDTGKVSFQFSPEQEKESLDFLRKSARSKYTKVTEMKTTPQVQLQERRPKSEGERKDKELEDEALNMARQTSYLLTGTPAQVDASIKYFRGRGANIEKNPPGKEKGIYIENESGDLVPFKQEGKPFDTGSSIIGPLIKAVGSELTDTKVIKYFPKFMGGTFETETGGTGVAAKRDIEGEFQSKIVSQIPASLFDNQKSTKTGPMLQNILSDIPGVSVDYSGTGSPYNDVTVTYKDSKGKVIAEAKLNSNESGDKAQAQVSKLKNFFRAIGADAKLNAIGPEEIGQGNSSNATNSGGKPR